MLKKSPSQMINFSYLLRLHLEQQIKPICEKYDLKNSEISLLMMLKVYPSANTSKQICEMGQLKRGNVSFLVEDLNDRGLITLETDKEDRRVKYLILTEKANPIIDECLKIMDECHAMILEGISEEELEFCDQVFQKMHKNLKNHSLKNEEDK